MKTNPTGIRFELEDLDFIKKRESLSTPQQVVYFLCSEYCKMYRVESKSVFQPKQELKESRDLSNINKDVSENYFAPTASCTATLTKRQIYINELNECGNYEEIKRVMFKVKADSLSISDRQMIDLAAKNVIEEKGIVQE